MRKLRSKQGAAIAAAAIIGAGAGGAAIAASGSGSPFSPSAFLDDLAGRLGVTTQKLKDASKAAALDQVDAALKAGTITQAQADELKARINAGDGVPFLGGPGFGFHHLGGPHGVGERTLERHRVRPRGRGAQPDHRGRHRPGPDRDERGARQGHVAAGP